MARKRIEGLLALLAVACAADESTGSGAARPGGDVESERRREMVATQIETRGIRSPRVLDAMRAVPRHRFVPASLHDQAYRDGPLPIGHRQTISQPYIVALMTELIVPEPSMRVLEVGTGSGYQAAVLAECVKHVYSIEIIPELSAEASERLAGLGYENVTIRTGDGFDGWSELAPFDAIVVTAAPAKIPAPLLDQLGPGGRLVIPVGRGSQDLVVVTRTDRGLERKTITPVRFVPMTGKAEQE